MAPLTKDCLDLMLDMVNIRHTLCLPEPYDIGDVGHKLQHFICKETLALRSMVNKEEREREVSKQPKRDSTVQEPSSDPSGYL